MEVKVVWGLGALSRRLHWHSLLAHAQTHLHAPVLQVICKYNTGKPIIICHVWLDVPDELLSHWEYYARKLGG